MPWVATALFILGIAVLAGLYWKRTAVIKEVRFTGHHFVPEQVLEQSVTIPAGIHPDSLKFMEIISKVEKIDYVKRADVHVEPGGDLIIEITERKPVAMLAEGKNKIYVDEEGLRLPITLGKAVDVPILYGFSAAPAGDTLKSVAWLQAQEFLAEMHRNAVADATISEIAWTEEHGIVALSHDNGVKLVFGKGDFGERMRNWVAFFSEVVREKGMQTLKEVDLRFRGQIVTRESGQMHRNR